MKKVKYFLKYKPNQTIFDLSNLEPRLKFQPNFLYLLQTNYLLKIGIEKCFAIMEIISKKIL